MNKLLLSNKKLYRIGVIIVSISIRHHSVNYFSLDNVYFLKIKFFLNIFSLNADTFYIHRTKENISISALTSSVYTLSLILIFEFRESYCVLFQVKFFIESYTCFLSSTSSVQRDVFHKIRLYSRTQF